MVLLGTRQFAHVCVSLSAYVKSFIVADQGTNSDWLLLLLSPNRVWSWAVRAECCCFEQGAAAQPGLSALGRGDQSRALEL